MDQSSPAALAVPALIESHASRLYSLGMRFCGSHEEAQDLVQETFMLAYKNWDSFNGDSSPSTWLYTIASRVCQRFHRKRAGEPNEVLSIDSPDEGTPAMNLPTMGVVSEDNGDPLSEQIRDESRAAVEAAILELPIEFRMPLVLKEIAGFALQDIAIIMDLPAGTVKTRVHRARLRLRQALESTLPKREVPPLAYTRQICLDLLQAKQNAMDSDTEYSFPVGIICTRCSEFFASLDFAKDLCSDLARGPLPPGLREKLIAGGTEPTGT